MSTLAFLLVILTAFFHASWNFTTKKVSGNIAVMWNGFVMAVIIFLPAIFFFPIFDSIRLAYPYIIISGLIHTVYFIALSKAYEHGDISTVYPIARGSGIVGTALVATIFLRDSISLVGGVGLLSVCTGVFFLGYKNGHQMKAVRYALLVGLMIVGYSIIDKLAVGIAHPFVYLYSFMIVFTLVLSPYILLRKKDEMVLAWRTKKRYSFIIGVGVFVTYLTILFVFQIADVSYVVALREFSVAVGAVLGFYLLGEVMTRRKVYGIVLIVIGMIFIKLA